MRPFTALRLKSSGASCRDVTPFFQVHWQATPFCEPENTVPYFFWCRPVNLRLVIQSMLRTGYTLTRIWESYERLDISGCPCTLGQMSTIAAPLTVTLSIIIPIVPLTDMLHLFTNAFQCSASLLTANRPVDTYLLRSTTVSNLKLEVWSLNISEPT